MTDSAVYPMTITPLHRVTKKTDRNGRRYMSFRALTATSKGEGPEMRVHVFGPNVEQFAGKLRKGISIALRVSFDHFAGEKGRGQVLRVIGA